MNPRRNRPRRGRTQNNVEAATERELRRMIDTLRLGLENDGPTFADAVLSLHQQLAERGDTSGRLRDVQCHLDESGTSALLYANWSSDDCVFARFALPAPTTEEKIDVKAFVRLCEG